MNNVDLKNSILYELEKRLDKQTYSIIRNKKIHLGIFCEPYLTYILEGKKTIESRFSKNKIAPFEKISKDDIVIVKKSSGNVVAYFTIKNVSFINIEDISVNSIKKKYNKYIMADEKFWNEKEKTSNYATLIEIDRVIDLPPFYINKKGMQSWIAFN